MTDITALSASALAEALAAGKLSSVEITSARPLHAINGYRAMFDVVPPEDDTTPINLRLYLKRKDNGEPLTETWLYQWAPPPMAKRDLHNPTHL